jgi:type II secretory pathway component PulJ
MYFFVAVAALIAGWWFLPSNASAQQGWTEFSRICSQNGGTPHRGGEIVNHPTAWCEYGSSGSSGANASEPNGGIIGAVIRGVQREGDRRRRQAHNSAVALNDQGIAASRAGDYEAAERYYSEALRLWPENSTIAENLESVRGPAAQFRSQRQQVAAAERALANLSADLRSDAPRPGRSRDLEFMGGASTTATEAGAGLTFMTSNAPEAPALPPTTLVQSHEFVLINQMRAYAAAQGWSVDEQARIARALVDIAPEEINDLTPDQIYDVWHQVRGEAQAAQAIQDSASAVGPDLFAAGWQSGTFDDCVIFALATASGTPYGVVAARAGELLREAEWRSAEERVDPTTAYRTGGLNGGETLLLAESLGQASIVRPDQFAETLRAGRPIMVAIRTSSIANNVTSTSNHQVVLSRTYESGGETWFEMINSRSPDPRATTRIRKVQLEWLILENGIALIPETGTVPTLLRGP